MNKIVSCIFVDFYNTPFGGRPKTWKDRYFYGLHRHKNNHLDKVVYFTDTLVRDEFESYLSQKCTPKELSRYQFKLYDLQNYRLNNQIFNLRKKFPTSIAKDRSPQICYAKFEMMLQEAGNCDNLFWCDAGLVHGVNFPKSQLLNPYIMSNKFFDKIIDIANDKMYIVCGDSSRGFARRAIDSRVGGSFAIKPVGGFFGGNSNSVVVAMCKYLDTIQMFLDNDFLYLEEQAMEVALKQYPDLFYFHLFETWYHEESPNRKINGLQSLYKVFI